MKLKDFIPEYLSKKWHELFKKMEGALVYFTPAYVSKKNSLFSPLIALIAIIWAIVLLGIAVGSFFMFFCSLLVLYFIITKIFGIRIDLANVVSV